MVLHYVECLMVQLLPLEKRFTFVGELQNNDYPSNPNKIKILEKFYTESLSTALPSSEE